jgi:hypothetical protein
MIAAPCLGDTTPTENAVFMSGDCADAVKKAMSPDAAARNTRNLLVKNRTSP